MINQIEMSQTVDRRRRMGTHLWSLSITPKINCPGDQDQIAPPWTILETRVFQMQFFPGVNTGLFDTFLITGPQAKEM